MIVPDKDVVLHKFFDAGIHVWGGGARYWILEAAGREEKVFSCFLVFNFRTLVKFTRLPIWLSSREALETSLLENEELHTSLSAVEEEKEAVERERDNLKEMAEQAEELAKIVKSLVPEDEDSEEEGGSDEEEEEKKEQAGEEEDN